MKRIFLIVSLALTIFASGAFAQQSADSKTAALAVVKKLFAEMEAANAAGILATGTAENQLVAVQKMRYGKTRIRVISG